MIRVVVVEDRAPVRRGVIRAVNGHTDPPLQVVGEAATVRDACALSAISVDVALVDLGLPDGRGEEVIRHFRSHAPNVRCVVLTLLDDDDTLFGALRAGAHGYLLKESKPQAIRDAIAEAHAGGVPLTPRMARFLVERMVEPARFDPAAIDPAAVDPAAVDPAAIDPAPLEQGPPLTDREHEVLHSLANGLTYAEVANALAIGVGTVQTHVKNLYRKLEVSSKTEAAAEAVRRGLVEL